MSRTRWICTLTMAVLTSPAFAADEPTVYRTELRPNWRDDGASFWYRADGPEDTHAFWLVDGEGGIRAPAFDHATVAEALARELGRDVDADRLPLDRLTYTDEGLVISGPDGRWTWSTDTSGLTPAPDDGTEDVGLPFDRRERPSTTTGAETEITFVNRLRRPVTVFWVDGSGRRHQYAELDDGERKRQHTYAGHIWLVIDVDDATIAVFEAADEPDLAVISDRSPTRVAEPDPPPPALSPDGRWEVFVRGHDLHVRDRENDETRPLSFDASPGHSFRRDVQRLRGIEMRYDAPDPPATEPDVVWSPDSRHVIAIQTRAVPDRLVYYVESRPEDQPQPRLQSYPYFKPGDEIPTQTPRVFDVVEGREIALATDAFPNPWDVSDFRWAPDGGRFTFVYNQRGHQVLRVIQVTLGGGDRANVDVLVDESSDTFIDYSQKTFLHVLEQSSALIWMSERSGWNHLYRVDVSSGRATAITDGEWLVREVVRVDEEAGHIWFYALGVHPDQDPYHRHLARVNLDGSGLTVLTDGDGTHNVKWSPDERFLLVTWSRVDQPPVHELRRADTGAKVLEVDRADAVEVLAARGQWPERFVAPGRDGDTPIHGIIHRPVDLDPDRRYPVVEMIYAGPHGFHVPKRFRDGYRGADTLTARGFVVVQIDGMGTNWRSKPFHDVCWQDIGDAGFPDRIAWMKAAAATRPWMDIDRVGIMGGSAGGQNAMRALIAHHDFYDAAVADCGCHDNRMDKIWWNEAWMGWPLGPHYAESSNVDQAHRLEGHLMLIVGERDANVDPASTMQVVDALVRADKDFDLVVIPGAGHGAAGTPYGSRRTVEFLVEHLAAGP